MAKKPTTGKTKPRKKPKKAANKVTPAESRIDRFVREFAVCLIGRTAAIRAGYSPESARQTASELLARADVQEKLAAEQAKVAAALGVTQELVLGRLVSIAEADPRELTELHRACCRYCWGKDNLYQRTPREMAEARADHALEETRRADKQLPPAPFNEAGGLGWNPKRDPNPACPECFGDGEARVVFKDTRDLSPAARLLFAGVEETQHGLKVRMHSQTDALVNVGKHLGMFGKKLELTGPNGGPVEHKHTVAEVLDGLAGDSDTGIGPSRGGA